MSAKRSTSFKITGIDSLGQGVSKVTERVTFIPKTALGDEGEAELISERKGVAFARATKFSMYSELRQEPACPHFQECPSCHFQHVSYESELHFKYESLQKLLSRLNCPSIEVIGAEQRLGYRNRIQLHYSLSEKKLGMLNASSHEILAVPQCLIAIPEVKSELDRLYQDQQWMKEAPQNLPCGHVEIYWHQEKLKVSWNRPYAEGGFSQVYAAMNQRLKDELKKHLTISPNEQILDLFAGDGNLSGPLNYSQRLCVDMYPDLPGSDFFSQNLYHPDALKKVTQEIKSRQLKPHHLILDPPRSGLKDLPDWLAAIKPQSVAYVSCDPHTLARDLSKLEGHHITRVMLIDFFPSTFHFETMLFLERKT